MHMLYEDFDDAKRLKQFKVYYKIQVKIKISREKNHDSPLCVKRIS